MSNHEGVNPMTLQIATPSGPVTITPGPSMSIRIRFVRKSNKAKGSA